MSREYFSTTEVARLCDVSVRTAAQWIDNGLLKGFRVPGQGRLGKKARGDRRVQKNDLLEFVRAHQMPYENRVVAAVNATIDGPAAPLTTALNSDPDYAWTWHCNIAGCALDEGVDHATANRIAARFMKSAFGVVTEEPKNVNAYERSAI